MNLAKKIIISLLSTEARLALRRYKPFVVAVTGSVGKTSTKDAIFTVLKDKSPFVRKSEKSLNSEIGLPLTILGLPNAWRSISGWIWNVIYGLKLCLFGNSYPDTLVLEIGADHPGDIRKAVSLAQPDIAVITKVSRTPVHVEFFKSPEQVFEEKASLARGLKAGKTAVLYGDDERLLALAQELKAKDTQVITFGESSSSFVNGKYADGKYTLNINGQSHEIVLPKVAGSSYLLPLLAAATVGLAKGLDGAEIVKSLASYEPPLGRMNVIAGINGSTLIDDSYNSSPDAVVSALHTLFDRSVSATGRKIAVLGDMMELGKYSVEEHKKIGREVAALIFDRGAKGEMSSGVIGSASSNASRNILVTVGQRSLDTAHEAVAMGVPENSVKHFDTAEQAAEFLLTIVSDGDLVLIKGSQSMRMEKVTKALLNEPQKAATLLVRQEKEWLEKK